MVTGKDVIVEFQALTGWSGSNLRTRLRWLTTAEVTPKGKGGRSGAGAAEFAVDDVAMLLLGLAAKEAKDAPDSAVKLAAALGPKNQTLLDTLTAALTMDLHDTKAFIHSLTLPIGIEHNLLSFDAPATVEWIGTDIEGVLVKQYFCTQGPPTSASKKVKKKVKRGNAAESLPSDDTNAVDMPRFSHLVRFQGSIIRLLGVRLGFITGVDAEVKAVAR